MIFKVTKIIGNSSKFISYIKKFRNLDGKRLIVMDIPLKKFSKKLNHVKEKAFALVAKTIKVIQ